MLLRNVNLSEMDNVMELSQLIRYSPKRSLMFQQCKEELSPEGTGVLTSSPN